MKRIYGVVLATMISACFLGAGLLAAQEEPADVVENVIAAAMESEAPAVSPQEATRTASIDEKTPVSAVAPDAKVPEWVWGEVTSVDKDNNSFEIKHLDYETYEEVTKVIRVDEKTLFENASVVSDLKIGDKVTIDYKTKDGAAFAELVVLEKDRPIESTPAVAEEDDADMAESVVPAQTPVEVPAASAAE